MTIMEIIWTIVILWNIIGGFVWIVACRPGPSKFYTETYGVEFLNPFWIYKNIKVNFFGMFVLCIIFNLVCPIVSFIYWFYKICTVGRK